MVSTRLFAYIKELSLIRSAHNEIISIHGRNRIIAPFSKAELITLLYKLIERNHFHEDGTIYLQVSRGVQARTHVFSYDTPPTIYAYITKRKTSLMD